jgi:uncharacterized membrane protein YraQ (UPF0718 family)
MVIKKDSQETIKLAFLKAIISFKTSLPIMVGVLLLVSLINLFAKDHYSELFTGNLILDPLVGALAGSFSFGIPITSYIVGGELLEEGVSLVAVTAFIMTWATVGIAMLPLEAKFLGKRFAFFRNIINFFFAGIIAVLTVSTLSLF